MNQFSRQTICLLLAVSISITPTMALAAGSTAHEADSPDFSYIIPEATVAGVAYPRRVLSDPGMQMLPIEVFVAACVRDAGIDPLDIQQITAMFVPSMPKPGFGIVMHFEKPYKLKNLFHKVTVGAKLSDLDGRPYLTCPLPVNTSFFMPDDKTLLIADDVVMKKMLANHKSPVSGPACKLLKTIDKSSDLGIVVAIEPMRTLIESLLDSRPLPPQLSALKQLPELITAVRLQHKTTNGGYITLTLAGKDEAAAKEIEVALNQLMDMARMMVIAKATEKVRNNDDPVEQAIGRYITRMSQTLVDTLRPVRQGKVVRISLEGSEYKTLAAPGAIIALLLPAVQAAREAACRTVSVNNLKQIALAMHNFHSARNRFPDRASFDKAGKPLLSWRVHILPFIDKNDLYNQFHLDEPWDSDHNKKLIPQMPAIYRNPSSPAEQGKTDYLVPTGKGSIFEKEKGAAIREIIDGSSNTIMVVEVDPDRAVTWTKPEDLNYDESNLMLGLGKAHPGGFSAAFADGAVRFISSGIDQKLFLNLMQMNDGNPVNDFHTR